MEPRPRKGDRPDRPTAWRLTWELPVGPAQIDAGGKSYVAPSRVPLTDYLEAWLNRRSHDLRPKSVETYQRTIDRYILPALGQVPLAHLTPLAVQQVLDGMREQAVSPRDCSYFRMVLGNALREAVRSE